MVKLAKKKKPKGLKKKEFTVSAKALAAKSGIVNINELHSKLGHELTIDAVYMLVALTAISDHKGKVILHDEEMMLAAHLISCEVKENGDVDLDHYKKLFKFYDNLMHLLFKMRKQERRKAKLFGEPPFPTGQDVFEILEKLYDYGMLAEDGTPIGTAYDAAVIRQQLKREGYDLDDLLPYKHGL